MAARISPPSVILDVGCGSGRDLLWFKNRGFTVIGLERSPRLAELAREHALCRVIQSDFIFFDFSSILANAVILIGALVHVPKEQFKDIIYRILQALIPNGYALVTMKKGTGTLSANDGRVFYLWQDFELRSVFDEIGIYVVESFCNKSALDTNETWIGYILRK